jgi:hypothetical protein
MLSRPYGASSPTLKDQCVTSVIRKQNITTYTKRKGKSLFGTHENTDTFIGSALIYTFCSTLHYQKISLRSLLPLKKINEGSGLKVTFDKAVGSDLCIVGLRLSFGLFLSRNGFSFSIRSYFSAFVFVFERRLIPYSSEHSSYKPSFIFLSKRKSLHFPFSTVCLSFFHRSISVCQFLFS